MNPRLRVRCPAKVNLVLRVLGRRDDGYHELWTVFQAIDLWDTLSFRPAENLSLTCSDPGLPQGPGNLAHQAAERLRWLAPEGSGAEMRLDKCIPAQAGLGGGSSDAAGALIGCCRLWGLEPPAGELERIARELGADVPFFLVGGTALGQGRGDRIERLPSLDPTPLLLGIPPFGVSTEVAFARLSVRLTLPVNSVSLPIFSGLKWRKEKDFGVWANDLESVVFEDWPQLEEFRDALLGEGARAALLSGSGSTVFGAFDDDSARDQAAARLIDRFSDWRLVPTRTVESGAEQVV